LDEYRDSLQEHEWKRRRDEYTARVRSWVQDRVRRNSHQVKHPVYDFLFEYYSFRPSYLLRWSPGVAVRLEGATPADVAWKFAFRECVGGLVLPASAFPGHRIDYLDWAIRYLEAVAGREPAYGCFGLHEWAMVYRSDGVRHPQVPLRLLPGEIAAVVDGQGLRCTHYDAFRFFTPSAAPLNRVQLTRPEAVRHDQPGCIHANMDLYRFAHLIAPYGTGELIADSFELAVAAREIDMRASPYDLTQFGFEPIPIETRSGREVYMRLQAELSERAGGLRERVLGEYRRLRVCV
jgi:hypothetical protein